MALLEYLFFKKLSNTNKQYCLSNFDKSVLKCKFESQSLFVIVRKSADQASTRIYSVSVNFWPHLRFYDMDRLFCTGLHVGTHLMAKFCPNFIIHMVCPLLQKCVACYLDKEGFDTVNFFSLMYTLSFADNKPH